MKTTLCRVFTFAILVSSITASSSFADTTFAICTNNLGATKKLDISSFDSSKGLGLGKYKDDGDLHSEGELAKISYQNDPIKGPTWIATPFFYIDDSDPSAGTLDYGINYFFCPAATSQITFNGGVNDEKESAFDHTTCTFNMSAVNK